MQKRILILSTVHPSGHPRYINKIAAAFGNYGYNVEVWCRGTSSPQLKGDVNFHLLKPDGKVKRWLNIPAALYRAVTGGHDLIVVSPPEMVPIGIIARFLGKKVVWDVEEYAASTIMESDWLPSIIRKPIAFLYSLSERLASVTLNGISLAEDRYKNRFTKTKNLEIIHNYVPKPENNIFTQEIIDKRWQQLGPRLLYVGVVTKTRGVLESIKAIKLLEDKLPNISFDVVGDIPRQAYRIQLENAQNSLKNPERITFHGQQPFESLSKYFANAQFGTMVLYPIGNHICSIPTKLYEYYLAGLPVIVGDVPLWRKLVDEVDGGVACDSLNPQSQADAIETLWDYGPEQLKAAGKKASEAIYENNFFWENEEKRFIEFCQSIIDSQ
jgi:glycosyltransferase involved in cell wall biosynthesis